ncbi:MAG TPA: FAD-dependent oxidoreductase [Candidatus Dormibacteraeota bacterium]|jgi:2-polyprenyl-6-methoxyphenol hydroxylase-like FAD-dependent oxidoreductase|nr:FAD-dependent oxidoreductase [Candidatus Dormibacteraeota bacterium]
MDEYDVVIAGAGPVGLMLGCELALAGVRVVVLERLTAPDKTIKAGAITTPTAEAFDRRGMLPQLEAAQEQTLEQFRAFIRQLTGGAVPPRPGGGFVGHFGAIMLDRDNLDESDPELTGHGPSSSLTMITQQQLEAILAGRAAELGVEVRRGVEVTSFDAGPEGVAVASGMDWSAPAGSSAVTAGEAWFAGSEASPSPAPTRRSPGTRRWST